MICWLGHCLSHCLDEETGVTIISRTGTRTQVFWFQKPIFFFKMSSLQLISVLFIMSFRLQFCQILFTHNTWNLGGENALCKWEETGGILDTCSLWLSNILLPFFFFFSGDSPNFSFGQFCCSLSWAVNWGGKGEGFYSSRANEIQGLGILTRMAGG